MYCIPLTEELVELWVRNVENCPQLFQTVTHAHLTDLKMVALEEEEEEEEAI